MGQVIKQQIDHYRNEEDAIMKIENLRSLFLPCLLLLAGSLPLYSQRKAGNPLDHLPANIEVLTDYGERADFSPDNKRVAFMSKTFGDAMVIDLETRKISCLTCSIPAAAFIRVMHLSTGDYLLAGPEHFENSQVSKTREQSELWFLSKATGSKPVKLSVKLGEGFAISKKSMKIVYTQVTTAASKQLVMAEVDLSGSSPKLVDKKVVYSSTDQDCTVEAQDFYDNDTKLTFFCYVPNGAFEVRGLDLKTGQVTNFSRSSGSFNEPEGIFPDGKYTTVEADRQCEWLGGQRGSGNIDIWKLRLDGTGKDLVRLTHFNDYEGGKAANPVVSTDGKLMAFQVSTATDPPGSGRGLLLYRFQSTAELAGYKPDPGRYDTTWWNRAPFRLVQTNLRETDAMMDVDAYVQSMVDASATVVLLNVGGIVANYPTRLPYQFRNIYMKGDLVGDLVSKLHAKGIKVIGRFDFSKINETLAAKKPEWLYVGTDGQHVNYNGQVHTCINGGYQQQYSLEILTEAITKYPLDGIFFNMIGYTTSDYSDVNHGICQCESCRKRFRDSTGNALPLKTDMNDPVFRQYNAFRKTTADRLFREIAAHIRKLNPRLIIDSYADAGVDMIASESGASLSPEYEWNYSGTDNVKRTLGSYKDRSPCNLLIYFQAIGYRHVGTSPNLAKVWMLENMLQGAPLGFVVVGTLVNYEERAFIPTLKDLYGFHKTHEELFTNLRPVNRIGLVRGSRNEYEGIIKLLTEEHILFDVIEPAAIGSGRMPRQLEDYEALILGDVSSMDARLVAAIDQYVRDGGKLLSTGFTSTSDELGKPSNTIRLQSLGVQPGFELFKQSKSTYLKVADKDKAALGQEAFRDFSIMMMYSDFLKCKPAGEAQTFLKLLPSTRFGPPEKSYYTGEDITDFPGLISNVYGKGRSVFIPWMIGAQYHLKGNYAQRALFLSSLDHLLQVERTIQTDASPLIEMTQEANRNGAFEWIGLINHSGQIGGSLREPLPIHDTHLRWKPLKPVKEIQLLRSGAVVDFKEKDGWVELTVPRLVDFEMILCRYR